MYDSARLAFARKVRCLYAVSCEHSPTYSSSLDLSAAVDIIAAKISRHCSTQPGDARPPAAPANTRALFPHQLRAVLWFRALFGNNLNGILADEMGLGKTMSAATYLSWLTYFTTPHSLINNTNIKELFFYFQQGSHNGAWICSF